MKDIQLDIIILSFNDPRIFKAIESVRLFDDIDAVRIIVIDGGSDIDLVESIQSLLADHDILIVEEDDGIFDALNKGLKKLVRFF